MLGVLTSMFYSFLVREEDRNLLLFLWFQDNLTNDIVVLYEGAHFRTHSSPIVAIYGLRQSVKGSETDYDPDVKNFMT